jgi:predicted Fe-Mo cluster-binding NifX family protein
MKIAISSKDGKFNTQFSSRFGRCDYFVFVDTITKSWESKSNPAVFALGGAGTNVVKFLADNGAEAVISGRYGPNAFAALESAGIQAFQARSGTPEELVDRFLAGELKQVYSPSGSARHRTGGSR